MKVRIKRDDLFLKLREHFKPNQALMVYDGTVGTNLYNFVPAEIELEISESDIVKEKTNRDKWVCIFNTIRSQKYLAGSIVTASELLSKYGYDATKAYEKIVEGKNGHI